MADDFMNSLDEIVKGYQRLEKLTQGRLTGFHPSHDLLLQTTVEVWRRTRSRSSAIDPVLLPGTPYPNPAGRSENCETCGEFGCPGAPGFKGICPKGPKSGGSIARATVYWPNAVGDGLLAEEVRWQESTHALVVGRIRRLIGPEALVGQFYREFSDVTKKQELKLDDQGPPRRMVFHRFLLTQVGVSVKAGEAGLVVAEELLFVADKAITQQYGIPLQGAAVQ